MVKLSLGLNRPQVPRLHAETKLHTNTKPPHSFRNEEVVFCIMQSAFQTACPNYLLLIAACAAASLAIGTRNGEQDT